MNDKDITTTNSDYQVQLLYVLMTDEGFLKSVGCYNCEKYFNETKAWGFTAIREHYAKYRELPSLAVLSNLATQIQDNVQQAAATQLINVLQTLFNNPPTNTQFIKDKFQESLKAQALKEIILNAADMVNMDPELARQSLFTELTKLSLGASLAGTVPIRSITEFQRPLDNDPDELVLNRILCRKGKMLITGPSGVGKSVLATQLAMAWAVGKECIGLKPTRPLKTLIIQAEDDDGYLGEMKDSICRNLNILPDTDEAILLKKNVMVACHDSSCGAKFIEQLHHYLTQYTPDILLINPVLSYLGGDSNAQKDVSKFLRNGLNPILSQYKCACILITHPPKPLRDKANRWQSSDFSYSTAGSMEWSNWARVTFTLVNTSNPDVCILRANKLDRRLKWTNPITGERTNDIYIAKSDDATSPFWTVATPEAIKSTTKNISNNKRLTMLLELTPEAPNTISKAELTELSGIKSSKTLSGYMEVLIADKKVTPSYGHKGKILFSRTPLKK